MADGSVGSVFLDLVVRDTVDKQVQAMAEKAQATTQKSFAGMEQAISAAVDKAVAKATKAATSAASSASRAATQAADAAQKAVQAAASSATSCGQQVENAIGQSFSKSVAIAQSKVAQLEKAFDAVTYKLDGQWYSGAFDPASKATQKLLAEQEKLMAQLEAAQDRLAIEVQAAAQKRAAAEEAAAQKAAQAEAREKAKQEAAAQKAAAAAQKAAQQAAAAQEREARKNEAAQQKAAQAAAKAHEQSAARMKNAFSKAFSGAKKMAGGFGKAVTGIKSKLSSAGKSAGRFGTRLKSIISGALVFNLLSSALRKMTDYLGTAIGSSSQMKDALANLKGAAMTATQPIIEMLTPALTALANGAATVLSYLTRLISFFTGKTVSSMSNAAKKIQSTAGAAKKAMASIAGFDEIQKLDSKDSSGGGGSSGADVEPNFDFQGQSSFLDSVMESVKAGNWNNVGALVAQKLNDSLASIKWPDIQAKVKSWVSGVAQTINGFIGTLDFSTVGSTISGALNTILTGINTFFQDVDWTGLGTGIGTGLSNMFSTLDWSGVGIFLTNGIRSLLEGLHGFVTTFDFSALGSNLATATMSAINNVDWVQGAKDLGQAAIGLFKTLTAWITDMDWQQIGNTIADSVAAVDWNGLVSSLVEGIGAACAGLTELIWGLIEAAWAGVVKWWEEVAYEDGQFTMEGLLKGIGDIFVNIGTWIKENIFDPFINGFKNAFDIHSPSGKMESMGVFLIQGLFQGISNAWTTITTFFTDAFESVKKTMVDIWENGIVPAIKGPINSIIGFINGLISGVCDGINTIIKAMNKLKWDVPDWVPVLGGKTFGFNLKTITAPQIPMLANGGVITQPTLAMMGEYSGARNNPEIAAPQSLIEQTLAKAMAGHYGDMVQCFEAVVDVLKEILQAIYGIEVNKDSIYTYIKQKDRMYNVARGGL